jgi:hypothetical protein
MGGVPVAGQPGADRVSVIYRAESGGEVATTLDRLRVHEVAAGLPVREFRWFHREQPGAAWANGDSPGPRQAFGTKSPPVKSDHPGPEAAVSALDHVLYAPQSPAVLRYTWPERGSSPKAKIDGFGPVPPAMRSCWVLAAEPVYRIDDSAPLG